VLSSYSFLIVSKVKLESQNEENNYEYLDIDGRMILRWILEKYNGVVWSGFMRTRLGASGGLL
jgi:hypothetical protein